MTDPAEHALRPLDIGSVTVRNRVTITAHITGFARDGLVSPELIDYHVARARGGAGLIITETGSVHPTYVPRGVQYFRPGVGEGLARLAEAVRAEGATIVGQLNHGGPQSPNLGDGQPAWSASDNVGQNARVARAITTAEIREVQAAFVSAAALLARSGYQGCEVHAAHSYLVNQFLSPLFNRRDDRYGGSLDARMRFLTEILDGIREAVPSSFVVGVRVGAEVGVGGLTPEDLAHVGLTLQDARLVDYVGFSLGGRLFQSSTLMAAAMDQPAGYELAWNELPSRALSIPTLVTGRFRTLSEVGAVIDSGAADLVGMTRAHIADPEVVCKTIAGRADEVRPCIACNECMIALATIGAIRCTVNTLLPAGGGSESSTPSATPRNVLVIGGGPAGLEAARAAALSGHRVELAEASPRLGGTARLAAEAMPHAALMADALDWLEREVVRLGVKVDLETTLTVEGVRARHPDVVVVATGTRHAVNGMQFGSPGQVATGTEGRHVVCSLGALTLTADDVGGHAIVVDDVGDYEAIGVAERLLALGAHVTLVTPFATVAPPIDASFRVQAAMIRMMPTNRFAVRTQTHLLEIATDHVVLIDLAGGARSPVPATLVVLATRQGGDTSLIDALAGVVPSVIGAGDVVVHRNLRAAIADGHRAADAINALVN